MKSRRNFAKELNELYIDVSKKKKQQKDVFS